MFNHNPAHRFTLFCFCFEWLLQKGQNKQSLVVVWFDCSSFCRHIHICINTKQSCRCYRKDVFKTILECRLESHGYLHHLIHWLATDISYVSCIIIRHRCVSSQNCWNCFTKAIIDLLLSPSTEFNHNIVTFKRLYRGLFY